MSSFFRKLRGAPAPAPKSASNVLAAATTPAGIIAVARVQAIARGWLARCLRRALLVSWEEQVLVAADLLATERNYLAQLAIEDAEGGDLTRLHALIRALRRPYADDPEFDALFVKRPEWARHKAGCSMLSCSS